MPANPAADQILLGGLVIGDTRDKPLLRRVFKQAQVVHLSAQAARGARVKAPLQMEMTLADATGKVVKKIERNLPADAVVVPVNVSLALDGLAAGPYLLQVTLSSGRAKSSQQVPIEIR